MEARVIGRATVGTCTGFPAIWEQGGGSGRCGCMVVIGVVELEVRTARTSFAPARLPVGVRGRVGFVGVYVG